MLQLAQPLPANMPSAALQARLRLLECESWEQLCNAVLNSTFFRRRQPSGGSQWLCYDESYLMDTDHCELCGRKGLEDDIWEDPSHKPGGMSPLRRVRNPFNALFPFAHPICIICGRCWLAYKEC